jgi:glycosyltransferase involved in cell wall biosynthesis
MITAIIPTLNEESFIEEAIASVSFADEIIVIDSFSTDKTIELAKRHQVRIIQRKFDDFSSQKNYAIDHATHNWIFVLDADERVSQALQSEILAAVDHPGDCVGFYTFRTFYFKEDRIRYGGWQTDKVIRLFKKDSCRYDGKLVHEKIQYDGKIGFLKSRIDHFSFRDMEQYKGKLDLYALLQARELMQVYKEIPLGHRWVKSGFRFLVLYFIRFGFLDGKHGYTLARLHARAVRQRYIQFDSLKKQSDLKESDRNPKISEMI